MIKDKNAEGNDKYKGYLVDLVNGISKHAKFKYTIHEQPDTKLGSLVDGAWDGMIGELISGVTWCHSIITNICADNCSTLSENAISVIFDTSRKNT